MTHKGAFDYSIGLRQEESWLCLANEVPLCTVNQNRIKAGNKLLFRALFLFIYLSFFFFNKLYQQAFWRPDKTGQEGAAPEAVPTKGGRIGNGQLISFPPFSVLFSVREHLSCCTSECFSK